jgi:hypothetical protein
MTSSRRFSQVLFIVMFIFLSISVGTIVPSARISGVFFGVLSVNIVGSRVMLFLT